MLKQYPVWLGLAVIVVMHFVGGGWWLDSGDRVRTMLIAVAAASFVVGVTSNITSPKNTWLPGLHFWFGFTAGMVAVLFLSGPGSIWPIVLVIGSGMAGMAITVGFVSGMLIRMGFKAVTS
jgi:hypothetical protein